MTSLSQRRVYVGEFFEQATQQLFNANRHINDSTKDWCPDISIPGSPPHYLEVKAAGNSRCLILYKDRLQIEQGQLLYYVVWEHTAHVMKSHTRDQLYANLAANTTCARIVPLSAVLHAVSQTQEREFQQRRTPSLGKDAGYKTGYRVSTWRLKQASQQSRLIFMSPVAGQALPPFTLWCSDTTLLSRV